jgi:hypothetical protein
MGSVRLDKQKYYDYYRLIKVGRLMDFDDIKEGETYHIPPTILYDRRDFKANRVNADSVNGLMSEGGGPWVQTTIYRGELCARFMVKKQDFGE